MLPIRKKTSEKKISEEKQAIRKKTLSEKIRKKTILKAIRKKTSLKAAKAHIYQ
jgi:hypothetical protein